MQKKILVAEDSPTILGMLAAILEGAGYTAIKASDGQEALDLAKSQKPDLILLDLMLPKIDGYRVCGMLKFDKHFSSVPIVILTARAGDEDKAMAGEVKADAYITKPFEPDTLLAKIKELLKD